MAERGNSATKAVGLQDLPKIPVEVKVGDDFAGAVLRPGDRLVVRIQHDMTRVEVDAAAERLKQLLPGVTPVFVVADQILVYRDGGSDD